MAFTPTATASLLERQLWGRPSVATSTTSCAAVTLAAGGLLAIDSTSTLTFVTDMVYTPNCYANESYFYSGNSTIENDREPFYASTTVLIYVVATATVIAWLLFILLLIAPGHHVPKATPKHNKWLNGMAMNNLMSNGPVIVQFSSRPWLQKAAAFLVTVGLSIASAYIFKVAYQQYERGIMSALQMRNVVVGNLAIRISRVVSDVFIWLAQVQTLIRLFPRRKEKLIIKWFGFLLILLDAVFSCLNSFYINSRELPRWYSDAIPALSYLFQLSISLLYGAWVFYYVATKRRYAFIHRDMPSITIVCMLAIVSILIPVGFFVADVSVPVVAGWGDFFRWVGAAAASVLVWEWVERIEFLEREEKKSGILGREIFEEDEMFDGEKENSHSGSFPDDGDGAGFTRAFSKLRTAVGEMMPRRRPKRRSSISTLQSQESGRDNPHSGPGVTIGYAIGPQPVSILSPPTQSATPVSRVDTDTPSTVYAVHYHPVSNTPPTVIPDLQQPGQFPESNTTATSSTKVASTEGSDAKLKTSTLTVKEPTLTDCPRNVRRSIYYAQHVFKRGKKSPPIEVKQAMSLHTRAGPQHSRTKVLRRGLGKFVGVPDSQDTESVNMEEPTVIPAPPRGHAWSPGDMRHSPVAMGGRRDGASMMPLDSTLARASEASERIDGATISTPTPFANPAGSGENSDTAANPWSLAAQGHIEDRSRELVDSASVSAQHRREVPPAIPPDGGD